MIQNFSIPNYRFFYGEMLSFFGELKLLHSFDQGKTILFNNKKLVIDNKPSIIREGLAKKRLRKG